MKVYVLQHAYDLDGTDEVKLVGVYASRDAADAARARAAQRLGFRDHPNGFTVDCYELGRDHWQDGFASVDGDDATGRGRSDEAA